MKSDSFLDILLEESKDTIINPSNYPLCDCGGVMRKSYGGRGFLCTRCDNAEKQWDYEVRYKANQKRKAEKALEKQHEVAIRLNIKFDEREVRKEEKAKKLHEAEMLKKEKIEMRRIKREKKAEDKRKAAEARRADKAAANQKPKACDRCGIVKTVDKYRTPESKVCIECRDTRRREAARIRSARRPKAPKKPELTPEQKRANIKRYKAEYKKRKSADPMYRIDRNFSEAIRRQLLNAVKGKDIIGWKAAVGYNAEDLRRHLEAQFTEGMTWDNYGEWHIDHIRPKCSFKFTSIDDPEFLECWSLNNLQPLWAADNVRKGGKYIP